MTSSQETIGQADVFLQWKGTDACFDFYCPCGTTQHIDAQFAYYVKCPRCDVVYQMPYNLIATPVASDDDVYAGNYVTGVVWDDE